MWTFADPAWFRDRVRDRGRLDLPVIDHPLVKFGTTTMHDGDVRPSGGSPPVTRLFEVSRGGVFG
jgi:hypothetical protein